MFFHFVLCFYFLSFDRRTKDVQAAFFPLFISVLALFVGLRYASVDYYEYQNIFGYIKSYEQLGFPNYVPISGEKPVESFYAFLTLVVKSFGGGFVFFVFLISIISLGLKVYAFKKMSNFFYLSLLLYVSMWMANDLGQVRNGLASAIVLLSVIFVYIVSFSGLISLYCWRFSLISQHCQPFCFIISASIGKV